MNRRSFLTGSAKIVLVTSGLFVTGNLLTACSSDDDGYYNGGYYDDGYYDDGYYDDGYYDDGYYDDRQKQQPKAQDLNQKPKTPQKP
ncbi:hypothetical protein HUK80_04915 [Flavobacterium sp. MAH-1]|uniref:Uncharacterized protein n=1 Tax=Flavobacterium agri TaxID=2743471 RepID=A0A7Y8Y0G5_9FLAO|nr:hypothetical protein [Flavobacterium agri]NUY80228.1 hypothetical protein [Flavobacterium agri]NYA70253.1 hypothetical protein [Flavobacterium agri]